MPESVTIVLPIPHRFLSPNHTIGSRGGRLAKASVAKAARQTASVIASCQWRGPGPKWKAATVQIVYHFAINRKRDRDNLLGWCKAYMDGIADSGLVENDADFTYLPVRTAVDKANPRVEVRVERGG